VIEPDSSGNTSTQNSTGIFHNHDAPATSESSTVQADDEIHTVKVIETLETQKYTYLKVQENGTDFWVATIKGNFSVGETYHYTGGLLKRNFKSVEHNRIFEELYLVSNIVPLNHGNQSTQVAEKNEEPTTITDTKVQVDGSLPIAEIVERAEDLDGQVIQVSGKVVKVNPNIMDLHWIHLKDGSKDDYDLVLTMAGSSAIPSVGNEVTYKTKVVLNKDFGAGYSYELILENAQEIK